MHSNLIRACFDRFSFTSAQKHRKTKQKTQQQQHAHRTTKPNEQIEQETAHRTLFSLCFFTYFSLNACFSFVHLFYFFFSFSCSIHFSLKKKRKLRCNHTEFRTLYFLVVVAFFSHSFNFKKIKYYSVRSDLCV